VSWPYREGVQVARTYSGLTTITSDPRNAPLIRFYSGNVDYKGIHVDGVYQFCAIAASVRSRGTDAPGAGACPALDPSQISSYTDTAIVGAAAPGDSVFAVRSAKVPENAGDCAPAASCYTYSGSTTLTLTPLYADLDLSGGVNGKTGRYLFVPKFTHSNGYIGINFIDSALPRVRPFQAISWDWRKADPAATPDPSWGSTDVHGMCPTRSLPFYTANICYLNVKETGVLQSVTRVNGLLHTDSVCIQCSAGDSLIDDGRVRNALIRLIQSSNYTGPQANREEHVMAIARDTLTGQLTTLPITNNGAGNVCNSSWTIPSVSNIKSFGLRLVAIVHTHPAQINEYVNCPNPNESGNVTAGGSGKDWSSMRTMNNQPDYQAAGWKIPWYIMQSQNVYRMDPNGHRGSGDSKVMGWDSGLCAWLLFDDNI